MITLEKSLALIEAIKKKKILFIDRNENKFFLFFLKNNLKKKPLIEIRKENNFYENMNKNSETIFFSGTFHLKINIKKNFQSNLISHDLFKSLCKNTRFSRGKTEKLVIIFDGFGNLSLSEQFRIFSIIKKSDRNLKFIIFTKKTRPILKIFQKFFFSAIFQSSSNKIIYPKIRKKFFVRKFTKKYKKEKKLISKFIGLNFLISEKNVSRIFSFFFFSSKNKELSKKLKNRGTLFKNFYHSFSFNFLKFIFHSDCNHVDMNIQILNFFFYRLFLTKNQYFLS